jgi:hypothetical protein
MHRLRTEGLYAPQNASPQMPNPAVTMGTNQLQHAASQQGQQQSQNKPRNAASSPALNQHGDARSGVSNGHPNSLGAPNQQDCSQAPVAYMHISQRPGMAPGHINTTMSSTYSSDGTTRMSMVNPNVMALASQHQHTQSRGVYLPRTSQILQRSQAMNASAVPGKTVPSPGCYVYGLLGTGSTSVPRLTLNSHSQVPSVHMQRPQTCNAPTSQSPAIRNLTLPLHSNFNLPQLPLGHSLVPRYQRGAELPFQQIPTQSRQPQASPGQPPASSTTTALSMSPRTTTSSPFLDHNAYVLTQKDRDGMLRPRLLNNTTPSSLPRPMPTPVVRPPSVLGKHSLKTSKPRVGYENSPPTRKPFFTPPIVPSQRHGPGGTGRRLSFEAAKYGAAHMNLTSTASHGRINTLDPTDAPGSSRSETPALLTPANARQMQMMWTQAQAGRERGDSGVGIEVNPPNLNSGVGKSNVLREHSIIPQTERQDEESEADWSERDLGPLSELALLHGVRMTDVEKGTRIKEIADAVGAFPHHHGHTPSEPHDSTVSCLNKASQRSSIPSLTTPAISTRQALAKVRTPSYSYAYSGHEPAELPPSNLVGLGTCMRDLKGVLRAPEEKHISLERVEVLSALMDMQEGEWVKGEEGEWVKTSGGKSNGDGLELHLWAFEGAVR